MKCIAIVVLSIFLVSSIQAQENPRQCVTDYDASANKDYFPVKAVLEDAKRFSVQYFNNYKFVTVYVNNTLNVTYYLLQCGTPASTLPDPTIPVISIPVRKVVSLSSTQLTDIRLLSDLVSLSAVSDRRDVGNSDILNRIELGLIQEVRLRGKMVNITAAQSINPGAIFESVSSHSSYENYLYYRSQGLPMVVHSSWLEGSLIARSEWIKFMALFFNQEEIAATEYTSDKNIYNTLVNEAEFSQAFPTTFNGITYRVGNTETWYHAGGQSYIGQLLKDCGATYILQNNTATGSIQMSVADSINMVKDLDVWVYVGSSTANYLDDVVAVNPAFREFKSVKNGQVYNYNRKISRYGSNDYWETGVGEPGLLLKDLMKIFHPYLVPDHEFIWYKKLEWLPTNVTNANSFQEEESKSTKDNSLSDGGLAAIIVLSVVAGIAMIAFAFVVIKRNQDVAKYEKMLGNSHHMDNKP